MRTRVVLCGVLLLAAAPAFVHAQQDERPRFDLTITAEKLSFEELGRLVPAINEVELPPGFRITRFEATGPTERLRIEFQIASDRSTMEGSLVADVTAPDRAVEGTAELRSVNLARLLGRTALPTEITGQARFDLRFTREGGATAIHGPYSVSAERVTVSGYTATDVNASGRLLGREATFDAEARAYGAPVSAEGTVRFPAGGAGVRYEVDGRARGVDLRRLPRRLDVPRLATDLNLAYRLENPDGVLQGRATLSRSTVEGAVIGSGTVARFSLGGERPSYSARGTISSVNPRRMGRALEIAALQEPRYEGQLNAKFDVTGEGARLDPLVAHLTDSRMFEGTIPEMDVTLTLSADAIAFSAKGDFRDIQPSAILEGRRLEGQVSGTVDVEGRVVRSGDFGLGDLTIEGRVALSDGRLADVQINRAVMAGALSDRTLRLRRLTVSGPGHDVRITGVAALDETGGSNLEYFIQTPALGPLAERFGVPLTGDVRVKGTVTGNLRELTTQGTLAGTYVGYGGSGAATLTSTYRATVPIATPASAKAAVTVDAELVEVGGLTFDHLAVGARFADKRLAFDVRANRAKQTLETEGAITWHPQHQELHLARFALAADGARWVLPRGRTADIVYAGDTLRIDGLRLTSGPDQAILVEGSLGGQDARPLLVAAENVRLADFDGLFAKAQGLSGLLNLQAKLSGATGSPRVTADWSVADGSVRDFAFRSFEGQARYDGTVAQIETRLDHAGGGWLTANGQVPVAALTTPEPPPGAAEWDLRVRSAPLALGFVQAFTNAVAKMDGTTEIDLTVTGAARKPQVGGMLLVSNASFLVVPTGAAYRGVNAKVRFDGGLANVDELSVLDDDGNRLTMSGRLPLEAGISGPLDLRLTADDFEVLDSDLGQIEADAKLTVDGTLLQPRVRGTVEVADGQIQVDELLQFRDGAYAVQAAAERAEQEVRPTAPAGVLRDLPIALDVRLAIPNNLRVRGTDLRTSADLPIGVGDVNLSLGGDLQLRKPADGALLLRGDIRTVRGTYTFQSREFEVLRQGTISFTGLPEIDPALDLTARRVISSVEARVHIGGRLKAPTISLSSQPPLDEAEIFSLIVFNAPTLQLGAEEQVSLAQRASSLVTGFLGSKIAETVGSALQLDLLDIETGQQIDGFGPTVTVGEQFGGLYVKLRQTFGPETVSEVVLEYQLNDWARLQSSFSEAEPIQRPVFRRVERGGIDAIFFFSY